MQRTFDLEDCFSPNYAIARQKFLEEAAATGASIQSYIHPQRGPLREELATDVARIGSLCPRRVLVLISGTHGVEGFCGSAMQIAQMRAGAFSNLDDSTAILLVHSLNPYGFAFGRRVNELNVDLNRNFISFDKALPNNKPYRMMQKILEIQPTGFYRLLRKVALILSIVFMGMRYLQAAIVNGQYEFPKGLFYGGKEPSWSRTTWEAILRDQVFFAPRVMIIDYHTGLGPRGKGELISPFSQSDGDGKWRSRAFTDCFGKDVVKLMESGDSVSTLVMGDLLGYTLCNTGSNVSGAYLEFGTLPSLAMLDALMDENWAFHKLALESPGAVKLRERLLRAFAPTDQEWKQSVFDITLHNTKKALKGLASEGFPSEEG